MEDSLVSGIIKSASMKIDSKLRHLSSVDKHGELIVKLFLDTIMFDSCSTEVRHAFIESMKEAIESCNHMFN